MPTYRVYLIDGNDRVASYRPLEAETDAEAISAARQFVDGCDVEVWHLDRKIGRLEQAGNSAKKNGEEKQRQERRAGEESAKGCG